jgi:hypothetical protein
LRACSRPCFGILQWGCFHLNLYTLFPLFLSIRGYIGSVQI